MVSEVDHLWLSESNEYISYSSLTLDRVEIRQQTKLRPRLPNCQPYADPCLDTKPQLLRNP